MRRVLVAILLSGCYASHQPPADAPADAGACVSRALDEVLAIECPASVRAGERAAVTVVHRGPFCCAESAPDISVVHGVTAASVSATWDACACCPGGDCPCATLVEWRSVFEVEPQTPFVVRAGGRECRIDVETSPCEIGRSSPIAAPRYVREGDPVPVLVEGPGNGCGCVPRAFSPGLPHVELELCDCSNEDPCVDPGYQATVVLSVPAGFHTLYSASGGGRVGVEVSRTCVPTEAAVSEVERIAPRADRISDGAVWVRLRGIVSGCQAQVAPAFVEAGFDQRDHAIALYQCEVPCPAFLMLPFELDMYLGALSSGDHRVHVGGAVFPLHVP